MENNEIETNKAEEEIKPKKLGFFKRLRRGFSSVFVRRNHRNRAKSAPCMPDTNDVDTQPDLNNELRLSFEKNQLENEKANEFGDNSNPADANFRPPTKAPMFVNDFTAELKKSLKMRSKMIEKGETSEAIIQIEMTRSNYSDEENQDEIEKKTFEEKLALFESQISGGSLQNSLNRPVDKEESVPIVTDDSNEVDLGKIALESSVSEFTDKMEEITEKLVKVEEKLEDVEEKSVEVTEEDTEGIHVKVSEELPIDVKEDICESIENGKNENNHEGNSTLEEITKQVEETRKEEMIKQLDELEMSTSEINGSVPNCAINKNEFHQDTQENSSQIFTNDQPKHDILLNENNCEPITNGKSEMEAQ